MRNIIAVGLAALSFCAVPALAQQAPSAVNVTNNTTPGKYATADIVKASALVTAVDAATRTISLKDSDGKTFDIVAGDEVKNFAQIKAGDQVVVAFVRALTLELKKGGGTVRSTAEVTDSAQAAPGQKPGAAVAKRVTAVANVVAVDPKASTISLKGPKGNIVDLAVKNPEHFKVVKVGDQVEVEYTEAVGISVEPAAKKK